MNVTVDASSLERGLAKLLDGLANTGSARTQAERTAADVRAKVPVRSGRLRGTVSVGSFGNRGGYQVTYGGGLPYADYIEKRSGAVDAGVSGSDRAFKTMCEAVARKVVAGL